MSRLSIFSCPICVPVPEIALSFPRRKARADDLAGGVILGIANDGDAASVLAEGVALRHGVSGIVSAFGLDVGVNLANDGAHVGFGKDDDGVDVSQGGDDFCAFVLGHDGASVAFQSAHRRVGVDGDHQLPAEGFGRAQVADMADVQQVEVAVGKSDAFAGTAPLLDATAKLVAGQNLAVSRSAWHLVRPGDRRRLFDRVQ